MAGDVFASVTGLGLAAPRPTPQKRVGEWVCEHLQRLGLDAEGAAAVFARSPVAARPIAWFDPAIVAAPPPAGVRLGLAAGLRYYRTAARHLGVASARDALRSAGVAPAQVTHLVVVSATGGSIPGIDCDLASDLALAPFVRRRQLAGMGCSGAFYGLGAAREIVAGDAHAVVLVACVEVCSAHPQLRHARAAHVANSLFGDAAASLVVQRTAPGTAAVFGYGEPASQLEPSLASLIRWQLEDDGFAIELSPRLPIAVGERIGAFLQPLLARATPSGRASDVASWAVHPGGSAILDRVARALALEPPALASSRRVFEQLGNLSSPSVLFALALEHAAQRAGSEGLMVGFGPGLALEALPYRLGERALPWPAALDALGAARA